ncbi:hypothetical protein J7643_11260 [bacterium]|nr:hypothetical protein [bacterium]
MLKKIDGVNSSAWSAPVSEAENVAAAKGAAIAPSSSGKVEDRSQVAGIGMAIPGAFNVQEFAATVAQVGGPNVAFKRAEPPTQQEYFQTGATAAQQLVFRMEGLFQALDSTSLDKDYEQARRDVLGFSRALSAAISASPPRTLGKDQLGKLLDKVDELEKVYLGASALTDNAERSKLIGGVGDAVKALTGLLGVTPVQIPPATPADHFQTGLAAVRTLSYKLEYLFDMHEALNDPVMEQSMKAVKGLAKSLQAASTAVPPKTLRADQLEPLLKLVDEIEKRRLPAVKLVNPRNEEDKPRDAGEVQREQAEIDAKLKAFKTGLSKDVDDLAKALGVSVMPVPDPTPQECFQIGANYVQQLTYRMSGLFQAMDGMLSDEQDGARRAVLGLSRAITDAIGATPARTMTKQDLKTLLEAVDRQEKLYLGASALTDNAKRDELIKGLGADVGQMASMLHVTPVQIPAASPADYFQAAASAVQTLVYKLEILFDARDLVNENEGAMLDLKGLARALRDAINARPPRTMKPTQYRAVLREVEKIEQERLPAVKLVNPRDDQDKPRPEKDVKAEQAVVDLARKTLKAKMSDHVQKLLMVLNA